MKNLIIIIISLMMPFMAFSQEHFELVKSSATEEHPGIPGSPVTYTVTYYFIAQENGITVQAVTNDGVEDAVIDSKVLNMGDRLSVQYITKSYNSFDPHGEFIDENPYFAELEKDITALIFPGYDVDRMKTTTSFPAYYVDGKKYEFTLPEIDPEDIKRIYYP